jgi:hypothetical protein
VEEKSVGSGYWSSGVTARGATLATLANRSRGEIGVAGRSKKRPRPVSFGLGVPSKSETMGDGVRDGGVTNRAG